MLDTGLIRTGHGTVTHGSMLCAVPLVIDAVVLFVMSIVVSVVRRQHRTIVVLAVRARINNFLQCVRQMAALFLASHF
jgi:hypothetical protein